MCLAGGKRERVREQEQNRLKELEGGGKERRRVERALQTRCVSGSVCVQPVTLNHMPAKSIETGPRLLYSISLHTLFLSLSVYRELDHNDISGTIEDTSGAFTGLKKLRKL